MFTFKINEYTYLNFNPIAWGKYTLLLNIRIFYSLYLYVTAEGVDQKPNAFEFTPVRPSLPSNKGTYACRHS